MRIAEYGSMYTAAQRFRAAALETDGSLFSQGTPIWSMPVLAGLIPRLLNLPEQHAEGEYLSQMRTALGGASALEVQLAAEALYVHYLIEGDTQGSTTRERIVGVLALLPQPISIPPDLNSVLDVDLGLGEDDRGIPSLIYLLGFVLRWKRLGPDPHVRPPADPWSFKARVVAATDEDAAGEAYRQTLPHLLFPDSFEANVLPEDEWAIVQHFSAAVAGMQSDDVDRSIRQIRDALSATYGEGFNFYDPEVRALWDPGAASDAAQLIEWLLPDKAVRESVLTIVADAIDAAHLVNPNAWGTTLRRDEIRLNVGQLETLVLREGAVYLVVDGTYIQVSQKADLRRFGFRCGQYRSMIDACGLALPPDEVAAEYYALREAHEALVVALARRYTRTTFARFHSTQVIDYLGHALGRDIPNPAYAR